jgi:Uma2 family endonuclease
MVPGEMNINNASTTGGEGSATSTFPHLCDCSDTPTAEGYMELHDREASHVPPTWRYQILQDRISTLLKARMSDLGVVLCEMSFRLTSEYEVWQADVGYVRADRAARISKDDYLRGSPDLVVEVLSPWSTVGQSHYKEIMCMEHGCFSFWVVDDDRKIVSVTEGNVTKHYGPLSGIVRSYLSEDLPVGVILA